MCIANEFTILKSIYTLITLHPLIKIQYIKQTKTQHIPLIERTTTLAQQAQQSNPSSHCIVNTLQLSAELIIDNKKV
jgi:hypothetical protein